MTQHDIEPISGDDQGADLTEARILFAEADTAEFFVEFAMVGTDMVYHFWPKEDYTSFPDGFAVALEASFQSSLATDAEVHAAYTSDAEAYVLMKEGMAPVAQRDMDNATVEPRATFFVKVVGAGLNPFFDATRINSQIFDKLNAELQES